MAETTSDRMGLRGQRILTAKRVRARAARQRDRLSVKRLTARINALANGRI
jgi:uncharacterized membrane protein